MSVIMRQHGWYCFALACIKGDLCTIQLMLDRGANVYAPNKVYSVFVFVCLQQFNICFFEWLHVMMAASEGYA